MMRLKRVVHDVVIKGRVFQKSYFFEFEVVIFYSVYKYPKKFIDQFSAILGVV